MRLELVVIDGLFLKMCCVVVSVATEFFGEELRGKSSFVHGATIAAQRPGRVVEEVIVMEGEGVVRLAWLLVLRGVMS